MSMLYVLEQVVCLCSRFCLPLLRVQLMLKQFSRVGNKCTVCPGNDYEQFVEVVGARNGILRFTWYVPIVMYMDMDTMYVHVHVCMYKCTSSWLVSFI